MAGSTAHRLRIGLTGGIGSGKTAVADLLQELGAAVVDADQVAHALTGPDGAAMPALRAAFGEQIVAANGALDRTRMRELAFADTGVRHRLEGILHPLIGQEMRARALRTPGDYLVLVVPLLVEHLDRWRPDVDRLCVVDCRPETQIARVQKRSGLSEAAVRAILAAQASREQRLAVADDRIPNDGDRETLRAQVEAMHAHYLALAKN